MIAEYIKIEWDKKLSGSLELGGFDLQARATIVPYRATVIACNAEVCQINGLQQADSYDLSVAFADNKSYLLRFWRQSNNLSTIKGLAGIIGKTIQGDASAINGMLPKVLSNTGEEIGYVEYLAVAGSGLQSFNYWRLQLQGRTLDCYIVGVKQAIYFCMYNEHGNMIATVEKRMPVKNGKSRYAMYITTDDWLQPVTLMTAILHQQLYDESDLQGLGTQSYRLNSVQNALLEKYQPDFIEKVKAQAGPTNWPENMPLVQNKVTESQNTTQLNLKRIGLIVFIVFFIIILAVIFLS